MKYIPILILFLIVPITFLKADTGKALKLYEKRDFVKLEDYLYKTLDKDSLAPGIKYVYSLLLLDTGYTGYNIDSSYHFILDARNSLKFLVDKEVSKLENDGVTDSIMVIQKIKVEKQAYLRAKNLHTINSYDFFIEKFSTAIELDSVIIFRDELAYADAVKLNTYQAFEIFFTTYPNSRQIPEAKKNYEKLLFQSKTGEGKLANYISFLKENPNTPHRSETELQILEISCADNSIESYLWFIENYPKSKYEKMAKDFLYYKLRNDYSPEDIISSFSVFTENDSLIRISALQKETIFPVYENGKFSFINTSNEFLSDNNYDSISPDLRCGNFTSDFLTAHSNDSILLISLDGSIFYSGKSIECKDVGGGFITTKLDEKYGLIHKTGVRVLNENYDQIELLNNTFIKVKMNGLWGLYSVMGKEIIPVAYDDIEVENLFITIRKGDHLAITNIEQLKGAAQNDPVNLFFSYDDYFLIDDDHLLAISADKEALLDTTLNLVLKLENHKIDRFFDGWLEKTERGYLIYDLTFQLHSGEYYSRILKDANKIAFQLKGYWGISFYGNKFSQELSYDSVYFLHKDITLLFNQKNTFVRFSNDTLVKIDDYTHLKLLRPQSISNSNMELPGYLLVTYKKGIMGVFDQSGKEIIKGKFDEIEALGMEYIVVTKNHKKGLYLNDGKLLLKPTYDGISNYDKGFVSTLLHNKFGIYHYQDELLLSAKHTKTLKPYGKKFFLSESGGSFAFIDRDNSFLTEYQFLKIEYWNDSIALVKTDDYWQLFDIQNKQVVYDEIELLEDFETVGNERLLLITKNNQNGVLSSMEGEIIEPTFNDIYNIGTIKEPVFFAEKFIKEADFYIVIYYKKSGEIIRKQVFSDDEYWNIYCGE